MYVPTTVEQHVDVRIQPLAKEVFGISPIDPLIDPTHPLLDMKLDIPPRVGICTAHDTTVGKMVGG